MTDRHDTVSVNPQFLYRLRDANGALLYVGITTDRPTRMKQHQADKPWWSEVLGVEVVRLTCNRAQVEAIEKAVIKAECPIYNKTHNLVRKVDVPVSVASGHHALTPEQLADPTLPRSINRFNLPNYGLTVWTDGTTSIRVGEMVRHDETGKIGYVTGGNQWGADLQFKDCDGHLPWQSLASMGM